MDSILDIYFTAKQAYYEGSPILSDEEFDALELQISSEYPDILKNIGANERSGKVNLPTPMGSLNQLHNQTELDNWIKKFPTNAGIVITEKIDGNSCLLLYKDGILINSFSRGNGTQGASNIRHTSKMKDIPQYLKSKFTGTVRGELVIKKDEWTTVKELAHSKTGRLYSNSRNFVAGFMNAENGITDVYPYFKFVAFDLYPDNEISAYNKRQALLALMDDNFTISPFKYHNTTDFTYDEFIDIVNITIENSLYELDGIVVDIDSSKHRDTDFDLSDLNPIHARKIKSESKAVSTTVTAVEWNVSKDKLLKPIVHFDPVSLTGVTIRKASGYNARNIITSGIGPGAIVLVKRMGDVIPRVDSVVKKAEVILPDNCKWDENNVDLISTIDTKEVIYQQMIYFFSKLGIDFMGESNVIKLVDSGIDTPVKAIKATKNEYENLIGANGVKSYNILHEVLSNVKPADLFAAAMVLGRGMGSRKIEALLQEVKLEDILNKQITVSQITKIAGFENKTAVKIIENLDKLIEFYNDISASVSFKKDEVIDGKLSGQVFCPTGIRFDDEIKNQIINNGGKIADSFNNSVTILVAKDISSNSSKIEKAKKKGIKILDMKLLKEYLS